MFRTPTWRVLAAFAAAAIVLSAWGAASVRPALAQTSPLISPTAAPCPLPGDQRVDLSLDGVALTACLPFTPDYVATAAPDDRVQSAAIVRWEPFTSLAVYAVPYGVAPTWNELPISAPGVDQTYRELMAEYMVADGWQTLGPVSAHIFGHAAVGTAFAASRADNGPLGADVSSEWVVEAGERIWIIRLTSADDQSTQWNSGIVLASDSVDAPSTSSTAGQAPGALTSGHPAQVVAAPQATADLPMPSWWSGNCNVNNHANSYPLGGSYSGVVACGPLGSSRLVNFGAGVSQYEWQCAEYSKRYLYLAYGIPPYQADGKDVVNNCNDSRLEPIANGTEHRPPLCGAVLSYSGPTSVGHTSIVTNMTIDSQGNGSIDIAEQNYSSSGKRTQQISNWRVQSSDVVTNWLGCRTDGAQRNAAIDWGTVWQSQPLTPKPTLGIATPPADVRTSFGVYTTAALMRPEGRDVGTKPAAEPAADLAPTTEPAQEAEFEGPSDSVPTIAVPASGNAASSDSRLSSATYRIARSVIGMGGNRGTSASFRAQGTSGQPFATGVLMGVNYRVHPGYWAAAACSRVELASAPSIRVDGTTVTLGWDAVAGATAYRIYRGAEPYFPLNAFYDSTSLGLWTDPQGAGSTATNYTYAVTAVNSCGESSGTVRLGEFDFALTRGN